MLRRTLLAFALATPAHAATIVRQTVEASLDDASVTSAHVWEIDGEKFRLAVEAKSGTTQYIFNGKTFYVCGKLDDEQAKALAARHDAKLVEPYKAGVCQVVPSNFMARFFLSPMASVESVDASDGLKLTLGLKDYSLAAGKAGDAPKGRSCAGYARGYTVTREGDAAVGVAKTQTAVTEEFCHDKALTWRKGLWTEVAKTVLRQPGGGAMMKQLKEDAAALPGLMLSATIAQTTTDGAGKAHKGSFKLRTTAIESGDVPAARFRMPDGYKLFSPESLDLAAMAAAKPKSGEAAVKKEDSLVDMVQSAFFCAIAGRLGCFSN